MRGLGNPLAEDCQRAQSDGGEQKIEVAEQGWAGKMVSQSHHFLNPQGKGTKSFQKKHTDNRQDDRRQQDDRVLYHQTNRIALIIKRSHDGGPP
jgi:hypothetical protein